jgi:hypothetical protein
MAKTGSVKVYKKHMNDLRKIEDLVNSVPFSMKRYKFLIMENVAMYFNKVYIDGRKTGVRQMSFKQVESGEFDGMRYKNYKTTYDGKTYIPVVFEIPEGIVEVDYDPIADAGKRLFIEYNDNVNNDDNNEQ